MVAIVGLTLLVLNCWSLSSGADHFYPSSVKIFGSSKWVSRTHWLRGQALVIRACSRDFSEDSSVDFDALAHLKSCGGILLRPTSQSENTIYLNYPTVSLVFSWKIKPFAHLGRWKKWWLCNGWSEARIADLSIIQAIIDAIRVIECNGSRSPCYMSIIAGVARNVNAFWVWNPFWVWSCSC